MFKLILVCSLPSVSGWQRWKTQVIVTGAAGRTGSLVFSKLLNHPRYNVTGIVRTEKSRQKLIKKTIGQGCRPENVFCSDILDEEALTQAFAKARGSKLIFCTSAVPKIRLRSLAKVFLLKLIRRRARPEFRFIEKGDPYHVDYLGAVNQFKASKATGIGQVVVVSSMGGTQPENFLNSIGRKESDEKSGNILIWKRKAEKFLINLCKGNNLRSSSSSSMSYTIVHPGGLIDEPGGQREIVFGIDDALLNENIRSIPRADVAELCVQALDNVFARDRSFDVIAKTPADSTTTRNFDAIFASSGDCAYED